MRKICFWLLAVILLFACSPTTQIQDSVAQALTQTQAAQPTFFPTFTPLPTRTPYPTLTPLGGGGIPFVTPPLPATEPISSGGTPTDTGPYPPPELTSTPSPPSPNATSTPAATSTVAPTQTQGSGGYPPPATATSGAGYPPPSVSTFTPSPTFTNSPTPSPTQTIDPLFTPSITPSPTITPTPNPSFSPTPTPTQTRTPTRTPTVTRTPGPTLTPTPILTDLTTLVMDTAVLNAAATLWVDPPRNITRDLRDLGGSVCDVVCLGREWTSLSRRDTLVLIMYRTTAFEEAVQAAYSARFIYLARGFELASLPPGVSLAAHTWIASRGDREFVIFTSQGPAVLSLFWHSQQSAPVENTLASLARYMNVQARILRLNGYLTVNPNATPPP